MFSAEKPSCGEPAVLVAEPSARPTEAEARLERAAAGLNAVTGRVCRRLAQARAARFDETGLRVAGRLRSVYPASSGEYVLAATAKHGIGSPEALARLTGQPRRLPSDV